LPCLHTYARISLNTRTTWLPDEANTLYMLVRKLEKATCLIIGGVHWPVHEILNDTQRIELLNYKIRSTTCNIIGGVAVCLTFGLAYPPLALVVVIYVFTASSILRSIVQEHLNECDSDPNTNSSYNVNNYIFLCNQLELESYGIASLLQRSSFVLLSHSIAFCFFLLIDISNGFVCPSILLILTFAICVSYTCGGWNAHSTSLGTDGDTSYFYNNNNNNNSVSSSNNNSVSSSNNSISSSNNSESSNSYNTMNPMYNSSGTGNGTGNRSGNGSKGGNNGSKGGSGSKGGPSLFDYRNKPTNTNNTNNSKNDTKNDTNNDDGEFDDGEFDVDDRGSSFRLSNVNK